MKACRRLQAVAVVALALVLGGCPGLAYHGLNSKEIKEAIKAKDANVSCFSGTYAGARINALHVNTDKGMPPVGLEIDTDCKAKFGTGSGKGPRTE